MEKLKGSDDNLKQLLTYVSFKPRHFSSLINEAISSCQMKYLKKTLTSKQQQTIFETSK